MYLYHYYDRSIGPFKNLSDCSQEEANKIIEKLNKAGFKTIKVPGRIYDTNYIKDLGIFLIHDCNYINANVHVNKDGELVYITNKSNFDRKIGLTQELIKGFIKKIK